MGETGIENSLLFKFIYFSFTSIIGIIAFFIRRYIKKIDTTISTIKEDVSNQLKEHDKFYHGILNDIKSNTEKLFDKTDKHNEMIGRLEERIQAIKNGK